MRRTQSSKRKLRQEEVRTRQAGECGLRWHFHATRFEQPRGRDFRASNNIGNGVGLPPIRSAPTHSKERKTEPLAGLLPTFLQALHLLETKDGVDQTEVAESLRKVAQKGLSIRVDFFGVEA